MKDHSMGLSNSSALSFGKSSFQGDFGSIGSPSPRQSPNKLIHCQAKRSPTASKERSVAVLAAVNDFSLNRSM